MTEMRHTQISYDAVTLLITHEIAAIGNAIEQLHSHQLIAR